jgi:cadmium resistance protein CadD (predicted permease)
MLTTIATAVFAFAATNIDDIFILMLFFGSRNDFRKVFLGQLLGIIALISLSYLISLMGYIMDPRYIGLMGFFPVYLGIKQLVLLKRARDEPETISTIEKASALAIAGITIANGGDNIGVYTPLFTRLNQIDFLSTVVVFSVMVYLWCFIAQYLAYHPVMAKTLDRWGHVIMPVILLLLGVYILYDSETWTLLS